MVVCSGSLWQRRAVQQRSALLALLALLCAVLFCLSSNAALCEVECRTGLTRWTDPAGSYCVGRQSTHPTGTLPSCHPAAARAALSGILHSSRLQGYLVMYFTSAASSSGTVYVYIVLIFGWLPLAQAFDTSHSHFRSCSPRGVQPSSAQAVNINTQKTSFVRNRPLSNTESKHFCAGTGTGTACTQPSYELVRKATTSEPTPHVHWLSLCWNHHQDGLWKHIRGG
jgi:hypothetical protein